MFRNGQVMELGAYHPRTPILILGFNRPTHMRRLVGQIRRISPEKVYVSIDGPRRSVLGEDKLCRQVFEEAQNLLSISSVFFMVREENLGCREAVTSGLNWFFEHESEGIIVEDDCHPSLDFYDFCQLALEKFRDIPEVAHISGNNFFPSSKRPESAVFTRYAGVWGWATWKNRWDLYDPGVLELSSEEIKSTVAGAVGSKLPAKMWSQNLTRIRQHDLDSWAFIWQFSLWRSGRLAVMPPKNLVENLGFGPGGTNTKRIPTFKTFRPRGKSLDSKRINFPPIAPSKNYDRKVTWLLHPVRGSWLRFGLRLLFSLWTVFWRRRGVNLGGRFR